MSACCSAGFIFNIGAESERTLPPLFAKFDSRQLEGDKRTTVIDPNEVGEVSGKKKAAVLSCRRHACPA